jgi:hypothetical protein
MRTHQPLTAAARSPQPRTHDLQKSRAHGSWFLGIAISAAAVVFVGFGRTYYLKSFFGIPQFPLLFHLHGALFTAWMLLLILQAYLVTSRRIALHRRLGRIGGLLVAPMLITGCMVAIEAARGQGPITSAVRRGELNFRAASLDFPPLEAMIVPLTTMVLFGLFAGAGLALRSRHETHKRFMMLATIAMLPAAIGRGMSALLGVAKPGLFFGSVAIFILAMLVYDRRSFGRIHPVTLWGGLALMLSFPGRMAFGKTDLWLRFAEWIVN